MLDEDWKKVRAVFDGALCHEAEERENYINEACRDDPHLLAEVKSLLSSLGHSTDFMEEPAVAAVADVIQSQSKLQTGTRLGHYEVVRQINSGGMGEVYLAKDQKLDRRVAIKILNERFSEDGANLQRFVREAKAASALNHPNILVIHEIGEAERTHYMVSEFIEGSTLREIMLKRKLALPELLDISIQVATALAAAHQANLVHRDIKPENVMIRPDGVVKVLDFGLAKLIERKSQSILGLEESTALQNQTAKGVILGTVNYMSPEQAKGEPADERTDVFSLGVMIYELIAGVTPFAANSITETLANLIHAEPVPLVRFAANVPDELQRIIARTLRKEKDARYQAIRDLLADLKKLRERLTFDGKLKHIQLPEMAHATAALPITSGDVKYATAVPEVSFIDQIKRRPVAVIALVILLVGIVVVGSWYLGSRPGRPIESIAVLPFENESENTDLEYLSDGMTETLISNLSQLANLDVKARSSVFRYKGRATDAKTIARELKVQAFLNGKVRQRGNDLSFFIELVDTQTEKVIWSQTYNRPLTNLVSLQSEIALDISDRLKTKLSHVDEQRLAKNYTANPQAYQLYLRGNYHVGKRTEKDIRKGIEYFEQAIAIDPNYALAYTGLASAYVTLPNYSKVPWFEAMAKAKDAIHKALSLDNDLSDAHTMLGFSKEFDGDDASAEREYQLAIKLNPNSGIAYHYYGQLFYMRGKLNEALVQQQRALEVEPLSLIINREYGSKLFWARRYDEAIAQFKKTIDLEPGFPSTHYNLALVYQTKGDYAVAVEEQAKYQELIGEPSKAALLRESFAEGGWDGFLRTITDERHEFDLSWDGLAAYYAALGEKDKAFEVLNKRFENRRVRPGALIDPRLDPLRGDPRFDTLQKRVELN